MPKATFKQYQIFLQSQCNSKPIRNRFNETIGHEWSANLLPQGTVAAYSSEHALSEAKKIYPGIRSRLLVQERNPETGNLIYPEESFMVKQNRYSNEWRSKSQKYEEV